MRRFFTILFVLLFFSISFLAIYKRRARVHRSVRVEFQEDVDLALLTAAQQNGAVAEKQQVVEPLEKGVVIEHDQEQECSESETDA